MKKERFWVLILVVSILLSLFLGRYNLSIEETLKALFFQSDSLNVRLLYNIRLPRILLTCIAGGALAVSGMVFQTIFKNGLASPDILGTTSGCSFGEILGILFFDSVFLTEVSAFLCGLLSLGLVFFLSKHQKGNRLVNLIICGIIVQAIFTSFITEFKIIADPFQQLGTIEYWLMGGFSDISWTNSIITSLFVCASSIILYLYRWQIQMVGFGSEAKTMGVDVKKMQTVSLVLSTLLISSIVAVAGPVSWVGLLVPHMVRLWTKEAISKSFGLTFFIGAVFVLLCDTISRCLFVIELPISIVTSFFGAIYLMIIFRKGKQVL